MIFFSKAAYSQEWAVSSEAQFRVQGGTQEELPFWMYSNTRGRLYKHTNAMALAKLKAEKTFFRSGRLEIGGGLLHRDGFPASTSLDEAYLHFENYLLEVSLGIKHAEGKYKGLSATGNNILWSHNAPALPGFQFGTSSPLFLNGENGIGVEAHWEDMYAGEHGDLEHVKIHRKSLHLVYATENGWFLRGGLHHLVQWGGMASGSDPVAFSFPGYVRATTGRQYETPNNHLGSWQGSIRKSWDLASIEFFADIPFDSGIGAKLGNFPDGRFGIFWNREENKHLFQSAIYEFYTTRGQKASDNYLNHPFYSNGWTYKQKVLAVPFFSFSESREEITNNVFTAHHFGVAGDFGNFYASYPYRLLFSHSRNFGTVANPVPEPESLFATYFTTRLYDAAFLLDLHLASDLGNHKSPNYSAGVSFTFRIPGQE